MSTKTVQATLQSMLDQANPETLADLLALIKLGTILTPKKVDTGTISASSTVTLSPPALVVSTVRVVTSGTGGAVGAYGVTDAGGTPIVPPGGASAALGVCTISDDGTTLTFPNTITRAIIEYVPRSNSSMTGNWPPSVS